MIEVLAETSVEELDISLLRIKKSKRLVETIDFINHNYNNLGIEYHDIKDYPKLRSFFRKDFKDKSYLWLLSRRVEEKYYYGTWFDKVGKITGVQFRAVKYRLSENAISVLRKETDKHE